MTSAAAGSRGSRTRFKVALVLAVVLVGLTVPALDAGATVSARWSNDSLIMDSTQPTRSPASRLDGASVSGKIAVFANLKSARSVKFWVDDPYRKGTPIRRDTAAPFDLMGTAADGTAVLFNTSSLADGSHTLTIDANYSYSNNLVQSASFKVQNGVAAAPEPPVTTTQPPTPTTTTKPPVTTTQPPVTTTQPPVTTTQPPAPPVVPPTLPSGTALPTPQTTGVPAGVTLTTYTGPSTVPAGTVLDGMLITKQITNAGALTIRRSRIVNGGLAAVKVSGPGAVLLEDVEITSSPTAQYDRSVDSTGRQAGSLTLRRVYAHGGLRGLDFTGDHNPILVEDSYMAFNANPGSGERAHASAIRAAGGIRSLTLNNTVLGVGTDSWSSGILATYPENGYNSGVTVNGGLWVVQADNDGAYGVAAGYTPSAGEQQNRNFTIKDLRISTQYYSSGCPSGCAQNWNQLTGTNVWQNVRRYHPGFADDGQLING